MSLLVRREVILVKIETTYNTDPSPVAGTDAVLVEAPAWSNANPRMLERPAIRASLGQLQHVFGGSLRQVTFAIEMKGAGGAVDVPPEFGPLLRACAFGETINAAVSVVYEPVSTGFESVTIYYFQDGILNKLTGCRGNVTATLAAGQIGKLNFTITGHFLDETDIALPSPTYVSSVPAPVINTPFAIGGFSAKVNQLTFDLQNQVAAVPDMAASDGFGEIRITMRDVIGSYDPEGELLATEDVFADWKNGATQALTSGTIGAAAGNRYLVDMPAVSYREIAPGDREGVRTLDVSFGAAESAGDDDVKVTFT